MKSAKQVLIDAKALVSDPERWIKGGLAFVDAAGRECFCMIGAVNKASGYADTFEYGGAIDDHDPRFRAICRLDIQAHTVLSEQVPGKLIATFNDDPNTSHAEVLEAFDKAIASFEVQL